MQLSVKEHTIIRTGFEVVKVVDGDGLTVRNIFNYNEEEIRLYGIDAPEIKPCAKLIQDEKETHLPGSLLMTLGYKSFGFLRKTVLPGTLITIIQEKGNMNDKYERTLAYVLLPDGRSINEIMLKNGFAKPYNKVYCSKMAEYQAISLKAKGRMKGLFKEVPLF